MLLLSRLSMSFFKLLSLILMVSFLAACGGSGGGAVSTTSEQDQDNLYSKVRNDLSALDGDDVDDTDTFLSANTSIDIDSVAAFLAMSPNDIDPEDLEAINAFVEVLTGAATNGSGAGNLISYNGPAPDDEDTQRFRTTLWAQLALESRCGGCHVDGGAGDPAFMDTGNINLAHAISVNLVDRDNPSASRLVTKVLEGHNCWLSSANVCGTLITGWIQQWVGGSAATTFLEALNLTDPTLKDVGQSKQFPASADDGSGTDFQSTVYPLLNEYCGTCHAADSGLQQQPYLGGLATSMALTDADDILADLNESYSAARSRMNLESPDTSRLVARLQESHNCWSGNCQADATTMRNAIQTFSDAIPLTVVNDQLVTSRALTLDDGLTASVGAGRVESNVIAKWSFTAGSGGRAFDVSGIDPALDLTIVGDVEWLAAGGVRINGSNAKLQGRTNSSAKLYDRLTISNEYTIEAWVVPLNTDQGTDDQPARIAAYSSSNADRNFLFGQSAGDYEYWALSGGSPGDDSDAIDLVQDDILQATLQHVAVTYSATGGRSVYVNGELVSEVDPSPAGNFNNWDRNYAFVVGNEVTNEYPWMGSIRLLAIHDVALSETQIKTNFDIGVGQKFYLLFSISEHVNIPRSYIVMQVEQLDDYGYLFSEPFFVSLEPDANISTFRVEGIRIGVNGQEATVGQAYSTLKDLDVTQAAVDAGEGRQILSNVGTVIAVDQGPASDEFFLTFERLGDEENIFVEGTFSAQEPIPVALEQEEVGIKTFDEINETLSALTGIDKTNGTVSVAFAGTPGDVNSEGVRKQLPVNEDISGGLPAAQQMAVVQLAVQYCNVLIEQEAPLGSGSTYFSGFDFGATPNNAFNTAGRSAFFAPLLNRLLASNASASDDQPTPAAAEQELDTLVTNLLNSCSSHTCSIKNSPVPGDRVKEIAVATCATAYSSGMMLIQ
ncbi:MAG: LamG domain-containing protein [Cellvibrionaceae bacterium]